MQHTIRLFMWGYQTHFRAIMQGRAKTLLEQLGCDAEAKFFLVGLRQPNLPSGHPVCLEPEDGEWQLACFEDLPRQVEDAIPKHPLQKMFYGDEQTTRDKPRRIRELTIVDQVKHCLAAQDELLGRISFCSQAAPINGYDVVCILQLPHRLFEKFPRIRVGRNHEPYDTSLIDACVEQLLREASRWLAGPDPGRCLSFDEIRSAEEIIRRAASTFMGSWFIPRSPTLYDLFECVNRLSQLRYEGQSGTGRLVLVEIDDSTIAHAIKLSEPVPISNTRWARKLLQMAAGDAALLVDRGLIFGLGKLPPNGLSFYCVEFIDNYHWEFRHGEQVLLRSAFGDVRLPQEAIDPERFVDNIRRVFPRISDLAIKRFRSALDICSTLHRGCSLIITTDAAEEAQRLEHQGTPILPTPLDRFLLEGATAIDGTILADPHGICHAIGVILDGNASDESTPSRGARYNSAVRYVSAGGAAPRMAFIVSVDRTIDIVPMLRPRIDRSKIAAAVHEIVEATLDTYHRSRAFLDEHRFYLTADECELVNKSLDRLENEPQEVGQIVLITTRFQPDPKMNDSYFK